ncbi:hypothetical protein OPV22_027709 [Ensete ventricosum]|uniref:Secreted protein n=1 Tax=Ensete ventricosum TaxID=4639 RepID=A0AAV8PWE1_ENSVE|nr:hypothetical protein OPV22_027709 [Ensete ventricosum]
MFGAWNFLMGKMIQRFSQAINAVVLVLIPQLVYCLAFGCTHGNGGLHHATTHTFGRICRRRAIYGIMTAPLSLPDTLSRFFEVSLTAGNAINPPQKLEGEKKKGRRKPRKIIQDSNRACEAVSRSCPI